MHVVLVHGFLNRGWIMRRLAARLDAEGHVCHAPSLKPCDGRHGLAQLAQALAGQIEQFVPPSEKFAIVGFSMGAIVSRYYMQELNGAGRVAAFFSVAGPHRGTWSAYFYPGGVRQLRPKSEFLNALDSTTGRLQQIPVTCYWTPYDLMIRPLSSARWPRGEQVRIPALQHSLLVMDSRLHSDIARRLSLVSA
jgi:triacylglycerol lipase